MGIFDKVTKKVSDTGNGLKSKVATFSNAAKLYTEINSEERALEKLYTELGRLHYQVHAGEDVPISNDLYETISGKIAQLDTMKKQLREVKNIKVCSNCGKECSAKVIFCNSCGSRFPAPEATPAEEKTCSNCGKKCLSSALFCDGCGSPFQKSEEPEHAATEKICANCQAELPAQVVFCPFCGTKQ